MICSKCKMEIPDGSSFCPMCGGQIEDSTSSNNEAPKMDDVYQNTPQVYCKHCGAVVDMSSGRCTVCGKKYSKSKKSSGRAGWIAAGVCGILLFALMALFIGQRRTIASQSDKIAALQTTIHNKNDDIEGLESQVSSLQDDVAAYSAKAYFLDNNIAFVCNDYDSYYYHTYNCATFKSCSSYWAYNIKAATNKGYRPCPLCH